MWHSTDTSAQSPSLGLLLTVHAAYLSESLSRHLQSMRVSPVSSGRI